MRHWSRDTNLMAKNHLWAKKRHIWLSPYWFTYLFSYVWRKKKQQQHFPNECLLKTKPLHPFTTLWIKEFHFPTTTNERKKKKKNHLGVISHTIYTLRSLEISHWGAVCISCNQCCCCGLKTTTTKSSVFIFFFNGL